MNGHHRQQLSRVSFLSGRCGLDEKDIIPFIERQRDSKETDIYIVPRWRYLLGYRQSHLVIHTFIPDYTSRHYSQYITLGSEPPDVLCQSGLEVSSLLEG
jgi:hypothetical protein